tara:strand:+ start:13262 stop:13528 length:267 start_codon:yes stop_codon:yes gene_type:complete
MDKPKKTRARRSNSKHGVKLINSTIMFDEDLVKKMSSKEKKFHIMFCEDELEAAKPLIKSKKIPEEAKKYLRGWRQRMYNRMKLLKKA